MKQILSPLLYGCSLLTLFSCGNTHINKDSFEGSAKTSGYQADSLAAPYATKSVQNFSKVIGWKEGEAPIVPAGFTVTKFADGLDHPRWLYVTETGDVFVAESNTILKGVKKLGAKISKKIKTQHVGESANRITLFTDKNNDGVPEKRSVFLEGLNQPFGMMILNNYFYVANTDGIVRYNYEAGMEKMTGPGKQIIALPGAGRHWTKNIIPGKSHDKIYIGVGSSTNVAEDGIEKEDHRACIIEINTDGSGEKIYASGLRNPVGMGWAPGTQTLWTVVNERDELGDELVPDYLTGVKEGGFYGWPWSYYGEHIDPRINSAGKEGLIKTAIVPDVPLGSHTASLGLVFYTKKAFPEKYHNGVFITQHGSWNRSVLSGYKVIFIPFKNGKPAGPAQDFVTGFVSDLTKDEVHGRPVGIAETADGSLLVTDDVSNTIWRISAKK